MGKRRTRQHIIADLSANHVERHFLLAGHTAQRVEFDYGYDLFVQTFNESGDLERGYLLVQLKASDSSRFVIGGLSVAVTIDRRDVELWFTDGSPVVLIHYDASSDAAYWLAVQTSEIESRLTESLGVTLVLHVPARNRISAEAVQHLRLMKNEIFDRRRPHGTSL